MTIFSVKFLLSYSFWPVSLNVALMYSQELKKHTQRPIDLFDNKTEFYVVVNATDTPNKIIMKKN